MKSKRWCLEELQETSMELEKLRNEVIKYEFSLNNKEDNIAKGELERKFSDGKFNIGKLSSRIQTLKDVILDEGE